MLMHSLELTVEDCGSSGFTATFRITFWHTEKKQDSFEIINDIRHSTTWDFKLWEWFSMLSSLTASICFPISAFLSQRAKQSRESWKYCKYKLPRWIFPTSDLNNGLSKVEKNITLYQSKPNGTEGYCRRNNWQESNSCNLGREPRAVN